MGRTYEFGTYRVEVPTRRLLKDGQPLPLTPKAFDMLVALIERRERAVDKDELMRLLWPNTVVEEANLTQTVFMLRKALGGDANGRQFIDTVPRRGYRFAADVREDVPAANDRTAATTDQAASTAGAAAADQPARLAVDQAVRPTRRWPALAVLAGLIVAAAAALYIYDRYGRAPAIQSLAVLPLADLSPQQDGTYFVDGLTEALTTDLAQISALRVVSRTSTMAYRNTTKPAAVVGRELGADAFIEGSALRSGDRVRITLQLIDASSDRHLWAQSYERSLGDVLDLQREIARTVAEELSAVLTPAERMRLERKSPADAGAIDAYLMGQFEFNKRNRQAFLAAIGHFTRATIIDPGLAEAWTGIAASYNGLAGYLHYPPTEVMPAAKVYVEKALEINPDLAAAHATLANIRFRYEYNWPDAEVEFRRAIELNPSSSQSHYLYGLALIWAGRFEDAHRQMAIARRLDPLSVAIMGFAAWVHYFERNHERAVAEFDRTLALEPKDVAAHRRRGWALQMLGRHEEAIASFEEARQLSKGDIIETAALGRGYAMAGRREDAARIVEELRKRDPDADITAYSLAEIFTALGDKDAALAWLERAYAKRSTWFVFLKHEPVFDPLRTDPRFRELVNRVRWN